MSDANSLDKILNGLGFLDAVQTPHKSTTCTFTASTTLSPAGKTGKDYSAKTLEAFHNQHMHRIREERQHLPQMRQDLQKKKAEFHAIEDMFMGPSLISNANDITLLTGRERLERDIRTLEDKIQAIESGETESDYFLRVGDILFSYTDAQDRIAAGEHVRRDTGAKKVRMPANSVYSYFAAEAPATAATATAAATAATATAAATAATATAATATAAAATATAAATAATATAAATAATADVLNSVEEPILPSAISTTPVSKHVVTSVVSDIGFHRDKALETYLSALDPNNIQNDATVMSTIEENYGNCPVCDHEMLFNETFLDCSECGYREYILVDSEKPSYKDPPREMSYYAYKKINHLNEWLAQFQAKETTEIPAAVLEQIRAELRKERITDMGKLKVSKLKEVLKKLKLSRCYDHVAHILNRLNGISAPVLSREVEEKLRFMFKEIQFSFVKHCPKKRSNFLSYSFVLYKFCELLELDEYLPCFPLLKSREKLYMQDKIWQEICRDMNWQFIRTV